MRRIRSGGAPPSPLADQHRADRWQRLDGRPGIHGGAAVCMAAAVDTALGTTFLATGKPAPDLFGPVRAGFKPLTGGPRPLAPDRRDRVGLRRDGA